MTLDIITYREFNMDRPFAAFHSRGAKPPCWDAKVALGQDQQKVYIILNGNCFCLSCPSATFASQHGGFVPREWKAAKGLLRRHSLHPGCILATTEKMIEKSWKLKKRLKWNSKITFWYLTGPWSNHVTLSLSSRSVSSRLLSFLRSRSCWETKYGN